MELAMAIVQPNPGVSRDIINAVTGNHDVIERDTLCQGVCLQDIVLLGSTITQLFTQRCTSLIPDLPAVLLGSNALVFFKCLDKVAGVIKAAAVCGFRDGAVGGAEFITGAFNTVII